MYWRVSFSAAYGPLNCQADFPEILSRTFNASKSSAVPGFLSTPLLTERQHVVRPETEKIGR